MPLFVFFPLPRKKHRSLKAYGLSTDWGPGAGDTETDKTNEALHSCPPGVGGVGETENNGLAFKGLPWSLFPYPRRVTPSRPLASCDVGLGGPGLGGGGRRSLTPTLCALAPQAIRTTRAESKVACGSCCPRPGWPHGPNGAAGWRATCCTCRRRACRRTCRPGPWCCSSGPRRWAWPCA